MLEKDVFSTVDLYEAKNLVGVQQCIFNLGNASRHVPTFAGPYLGVAQVGIQAQDTETQIERATEWWFRHLQGCPAARYSHVFWCKIEYRVHPGPGPKSSN